MNLVKKLQYMAYHDPLTDLPNRLCLEQCLGAILKQAVKKGLLAAVLFMDLDRFKAVNDTLGHSAGDQLLRDASARIKAILTKGDRVARLGGDEFICILSDLSEPREAQQIAQRIAEQFVKPFQIHGHDFFVSISIGISLFPYHGDDIETLISNADTAMYSAKREGRSGIQFYNFEMNAMSFEKMLLEQNLRGAIQREEFCLHYQPLLDVQSNCVTGMEALLRWEHPEFGLIQPCDFIPIAEETGLIVPLGEWTLRAACAQNKMWQSMGLLSVPISVNVSAKQIREHEFVERVSQILKETGLEPEWLELEITETTIMENITAAIEQLKQLREMGIRIAVDDFGSGVTSLGYLRYLPLDRIKIDRGFIKNIASNRNDRAISEAIIKLAHDLELDVVAEGVETEEQMEQIRIPQCDTVQGFLFSKPLPSSEMVSWLSLNN